MKYFAWLLLVPMIWAFAPPAEQDVNSVIKRVTVFTNGAQVFREAKATVPSGQTVLKFVNLAPNLNAQSINVKTGDNITVLSVQHRFNFLAKETKEANIKELEEKARLMNEQREDIQAEIQAYNEEKSLLQSNKIVYGQEQGLKVAELQAAADLMRNRMLEINKKMLELNRRLTKISEEYNRTYNQINELRSKINSDYVSEVLVTVSSKSGGSTDIELSYLVSAASWVPTYDIRVKDVTNPLTLAYKANISQNSGEVWNNVKLTLSTGNPTLSNQAPTLTPWYLRYANTYGYRKSNSQGARSMPGNNMQGLTSVRGRVYDAESGEALIGAAVYVKGTSLGAVTDMDGNFVINNLPSGYQGLVVSYVGYSNIETPITGPNLSLPVYPNNQSLDEVVVTGYATAGEPSAPTPQRAPAMKKEKALYEADKSLENNNMDADAEERATTVTFTIDEPYTIEANGKTQTVEIKNYDVPAQYEYFSVPKLDPAAFLTAKVTDWERLYLLSGQANLFFEGTYLGNAYLNLDNATDTLSLSLGRDQNVKIERKRTTDFARRQFIGDKQSIQREYEIEVRNTKRQTINITIEDQFPLTTDATIDISRDEDSAGKVNDTTGCIEWKAALAPNETKKWKIGYTVKYPKGRTLSVD